MRAYELYEHAPVIRDWNTIDSVSQQFAWNWNQSPQSFVDIASVDTNVVYRIDFHIERLIFRTNPFSLICAEKVTYNINYFKFLQIKYYIISQKTTK